MHETWYMLKAGRSLICTKGHFYTKGHFCTKGNFCTKTLLHGFNFAQEVTFTQETFALRVNFAQRHFCTGIFIFTLIFLITSFCPQSVIFSLLCFYKFNFLNFSLISFFFWLIIFIRFFIKYFLSLYPLPWLDSFLFVNLLFFF